jgi:hypothetical protein
VLEERLEQRRARVVHEDVERAECVDRRRDEIGDAALIGDVDRERERLAAVLLAKLGRYAVDQLGPPRRYYDPGAPLREPVRELFAEAVGRAGDDCDAAL